MALCLAESLLAIGGFDVKDQMDRYIRWWRDGHLSSTGKCFDIGRTTAAALHRYEKNCDPMAGSADPRTAGNGSLMRLAPVPLFYSANQGLLQRYCAESSRSTHGAAEAVECCILLGDRIAAALAGRSKAEILDRRLESLAESKVVALATLDYTKKVRDEIRGSGYAVASLEAAFWCFAQAESFEETILMAANLGDDADTTAAIVGQLAGAYYGRQGIPECWLARLHMRDQIVEMASGLYAHSGANSFHEG